MPKAGADLHKSEHWGETQVVTLRVPVEWLTVIDRIESSWEKRPVEGEKGRVNRSYVLRSLLKRGYDSYLRQQVEAWLRRGTPPERVCGWTNMTRGEVQDIADSMGLSLQWLKPWPPFTLEDMRLIQELDLDVVEKLLADEREEQEGEVEGPKPLDEMMNTPEGRALAEKLRSFMV